MRRTTIALALCLLAPSALAKGPAMVQPVTCTTPIGPAESAASLKKRFGLAAKIEEVYLAEGQTQKAVVLFDSQPEKRMEVLYWDDAMRQVATVRWDGARYSLAGLKVGDGIAAITKANGKPFTFFGFDWDYGGWTNMGKGKLDALPGGCSASIRLDPPANAENMPNALIGDRKVKSTDPLLARFPPRISSLSIDWPAPKGR
ncbi:MAG: hypothetical protein ACKOPQ_01015 [Novosphingobium sp.]